MFLDTKLQQSSTWKIFQSACRTKEVKLLFFLNLEMSNFTGRVGILGQKSHRILGSMAFSFLKNSQSYSTATEELELLAKTICVFCHLPTG